jgi:hypothetical protein
MDVFMEGWAAGHLPFMSAGQAAYSMKASVRVMHAGQAEGHPATTYAAMHTL